MSESVVKALTAVMGELPAIGKNDRSPEGYQYRGIEQITKHLQPLLANHGVIIVPSASIVEVKPAPAMKEGWQDVYMTVDWKIYGPDGTSISARTNGVGRDKSDKGANKAQTQAYKYLLLHLLSIADRADDSDGETYEHERADARRVEVDPRAGRPDAVTDAQLTDIVAGMRKIGLKAADERLAFLSAVCNRNVPQSKDLSEAEARDVLTKLVEVDNGFVTFTIGSDGRWLLAEAEPYTEHEPGLAEANA